MLAEDGGVPERIARDVVRPRRFTSDDGLVSIYDKNALYGVQVGGQTFDVFVSDAFSRGPLTCGDCPATETTFLILRSSR